MWIVEVNVLGRTFTHRVGDHRQAFRLSPRLKELRHPKVPSPRAVA